MNPTEQWGENARQFQQNLTDHWSRALQSFQSMDLSQAGMPAMPQIAFTPEKLQKLQQAYLDESAQLWNQSVQAQLAGGDKRFSGEAWAGNPAAAFSAAVYLLNSRVMLGMVEAMDTDAKTRARVRFAIEQWMAASAPSNFIALNAEAQKKAIDSKGESIARGMQNLLHDIGQGRVSMTDETQFEVGRNMATSEGAVVFENELFQLLEYKPLTKQVHERPFLMVPPCINKFYILDLQQENSFVRHAVEQGHRTFLVSWRNPDESLGDKTWDDYIQQGPIEAIRVVREITGQDRKGGQINALGFCVGGTILSTALAVLATRGEKPVASLTLLTTLLDFTDTGVLDIFIDENAVQYREMQLGKGGLLKGQELASTFSFLRPNDLVWNYVVGNYLKGETPPPFDLLYWNGDSTNLPGPMYTWYLRNMYHENNLIKPGKCTVAGAKVDLGNVDMPAYIYGSREDHIVPIGGSYASTQVLPGKKRYVMGASGHIAGVINPPAKKKRSYWTNEKVKGKFPATHAAWLATATEHPGSWWPDWAAWLKPYGGKMIAAPKTYGKGKYKKIEPAPGRYVKQKA